MATSERLYNLLPAVHRRRDAAQGEPLRALLGVMEEELKIFEDDLDTLYENWFVETCEEWAVPYLGDLLGLRGLYPGIPGIFSQRAFVANTLAYRRRKGTAAVLEQLARDATGWPSKVVEFFELLGATQNINHPRIGKGGTANIRDANAMDLVYTAFDTQAHTVDVRRPEGGGAYNIPNVGIYVWPVPSYEVRSAEAFEVQPGCYNFSPLGMDLPLFNRPRTEESISSFAGEVNLPTPLRRRPLYDETENLRDPDGDITREYLYFAEDDEVLVVSDNGTVIPPAEILVTDLSAWEKPPSTKTYIYYEDGVEQSVDQPISVAVDPVLGRIAFPESATPSNVRVTYSYGFSGDLGGGPYNRRASVDEALDLDSVTWHVGVSKSHTPVGTETIYATLGEAVAAWNAGAAGTVGLITIMDNSSYAEDLTAASRIVMQDGSSLMIAAADWPVTGEIPNVIAGERRTGVMVPAGLRPHLVGSIEVEGTAPAESRTPGRLLCDGLLVEGALTVVQGNLGRLRFAHSTLTGSNSGEGVLSVQANAVPNVAGTYNENLTVVFERSIAAQLAFGTSTAALVLVDSIVHAHSGRAVDAERSRADIEATTILGETHVRYLEAENSIFQGIIDAERRQSGCIRYSSIADNSLTPRRFRCQPGLAVNLWNQGEGPHTLFTEESIVRERVRPIFVTTDFGHPAYMRLREDVPEEIRTGAEDGSEMGALYHLKEAQREGNLRTNIVEYLRFGKEAGVFFVVPRVDAE